MPTLLLNAYATRLPRLSAEESLMAAQRIAVGTGSLQKGDGRRIAEGWQRMAAQHRPVVRPTDEAMYAAQMAGLGIGVRKVKKADG